MRVERVESLGDPRVAVFRNVRDADLRSEGGLFLVEGRANVRRLIEESRFPTRSLLVTPTALDALRDVLERLGDSVPVFVAEQETLNDVVGYPLHRGCLAAGERRGPPDWRSLLPAEAAPSRVLVLEQLANPDNVGSIFRNALAFGAGAVLLCPRCCDPLYRKAIRVSMGATLSVPFARLERWPEDLADLRARGFALVALHPHAPSEALGRAGAPPQRAALLLGSEGGGLSPAALAEAERRLCIEMEPGVDSLNVATAAGIALHWLRGAAGR